MNLFKWVTKGDEEWVEYTDRRGLFQTFRPSPREKELIELVCAALRSQNERRTDEFCGY